MKHEQDIHKALDRLGSELAGNESIVDEVMRRIVQIPSAPARTGLVRRFKMFGPYKKAAIGISAAAVLTLIGVFAAVTLTSPKTAYALEQTVKAMKNVRYIHLTRRDEQGRLTDERWIEIAPNGVQGRYRQEGKLPGHDMLVVDDRKTVFDYRRDKNTVILWDPDQHWYTYIHNIGQFFKDLQGAPGSVLIRENVGYKGRPAHLVRWLKLNQDIYIDPETKLPIAIGTDEFRYEQPPKGIFEIPAIPDGVTFVDKRRGATPTTQPAWMEKEQQAGKYFHAGRKALGKSQYEEAVRLFGETIEVQPGRNWAHFWLGRAYYELGRYDEAIERFTCVIDMFKKHGHVPEYAHLARGMAYRKKGMEDKAKKDFGKALGTMIGALRNIKGTGMFDYADDPVNRGKKLTKTERFIKMIIRLREITGRNFGFGPDNTVEQNEKAVPGWERWWLQHAKEYGAKPEKFQHDKPIDCKLEQ